jgi:SAM-dependent methyltransferase
MPDAIFAEPRLAAIYDLLDTPDRPDLDLYVGLADELEAHSVIDLGCGTGNLACRLAARGTDVTGIDPAAASLAVAQAKAYADRVHWMHGTVEQLRGLHADLITMTGNVAQVFVTDEEWMATLHACHDALNPGGRLVFEVRDPAKEAWTGWTRAQTYKTIEAPGVGTVESWVELLDVRLPLVTFRHSFLFGDDDSMVTSESTLRFRSQSEIADTLSQVHLTVQAVRDAPDRPGLELVFLARRESSRRAS